MGRRGPLIAGAVGVVLSLLLIFFLVLPKLNGVTEARQDLIQAQADRGTLEARLGALRDAQENAPEAQRIIAEIDIKVPPTADVSSVIRMLDIASTQSTLDLQSFTPVAPVFDADVGLSRIDIQVSVTGTYFELDEFLFLVETLPRAARLLNVTIGASAILAGELTMQATVQVFTSDTSAGPGSQPGPTGGTPTQGAT